MEFVVTRVQPSYSTHQGKRQLDCGLPFKSVRVVEQSRTVELQTFLVKHL